MDHIYASVFVQYKLNRENHRGGGILIMVRNTIAFDEISIKSRHKSVELCGIQLIVSNANPTLNIVVCYRVPSLTRLQSIWASIVQSLDNTQAGILVGDFNSPNIIWNRTHSETGGKHLAKSINENDLFLHNNDTIRRTDPYYKTNSNIDHLFSTLKVSQKVNVHVLDETLGSGHYPIFFTVELDKNLYVQRSLEIKFKRTNWDLFTSELKLNSYTFSTTEYKSLPGFNKYKSFVEVVTNCFKKSFPTKKIC